MATTAVLHHDTPVMTAQGLSHELDIYSDRLVIRQTDVLSRLFGHDEIIFYDDIKSLHAFKPSSVSGNWSQLIITCKNGKSRGLSYSEKNHHLAQHIKETVEDILKRREGETDTKSV